MEPVSAVQENHIVAIVCGLAALIVVLMFGIFAWALYSERRCGAFCCWGGSRRRSRPRAGSEGSTAGSEVSVASSTAKPSAPDPAFAVAHEPSIPVIVIGPDGSTALGTVPGAKPPPGPAPTAPAAARREPTRAERRAAEELRAAYIAELEEREAARHSYARRTGGLAGSSMGWSALSFLPYLV